MSDAMKDYTATLGSTAVATIAAALGTVVESAASDGIDKTTGWALGIIVGGTGVFGFFWRKYTQQEVERAAERRKADERLLEQNETLQKERDLALSEARALQSEVRVLYQRLLDGHVS